MYSIHVDIYNIYVHACECGEKMPDDYQMTIVCVQEQNIVWEFQV